jgi:xylitol oxidase
VSEPNWAGNYVYRAREIHRPSTLEQVQETVADAGQVRVLGSRHSFTDIADSEELIALGGLPPDIIVDHSAATVSFSGAVTYGELIDVLNEEEVALANLASLPHISVAGSVSTATHGSGDRLGNLATSVAGIEIVASTGELITASRGDPDYNGLVIGLGALGAITRVTLDVVPAYRMRQRVYENLGWDALMENLDDIFTAAYSVSAFTRWAEVVDQVWVKSRVADDSEPPPSDDFFGATPATVERHPIPGLDPENCSRQLGVVGSWSDRLPHFRMGFMPSSGRELQSEYLVPRRHAVEAIQAMRSLAHVIQPALQVSELRTVAADSLWMSPQQGQDTLGIHFTWRPEPGQVDRVLTEVEPALGRFHARPHWGKVFLADATTIGSRYERLPDFVRLADRLDPRGAFRNSWLTNHVLGGT